MKEHLPIILKVYLLFYVHKCLFARVYVHSMNAMLLQAKGRCQISENGAIDGGEPPCGVMGTEPGCKSSP